MTSGSTGCDEAAGGSLAAMSVVIEAAARGSVLVLCPTLRMARLGAASLRRKGLTTAELPDQVDAAIAGVDVVIGRVVERVKEMESRGFTFESSGRFF